MSDEELKKQLAERVKRDGRQIAISDLTRAGLSPSFAEKAVDARWTTSKFQQRTKDALLKVLGSKRAS